MLKHMAEDQDVRLIKDPDFFQTTLHDFYPLWGESGGGGVVWLVSGVEEGRERRNRVWIMGATNSRRWAVEKEKCKSEVVAPRCVINRG